ncbi:hypothetical protein LTS08_000245 [Lithohypha guttulata]|uniref:uncharacterized protein n=1 Tax=Lithohypha guttulata TaxID=1690604 RepID=UPI002DDE4C79|nr:hypothetical protein LTR51_007132 [Lithohypha guttulata]KAK5106128.1 hypothetical protein LTS08_000245 [Lithohypha guttulata]
MPCPNRFAAALQETVTTEDGVKMYTWRAVRRQHLRMLRKQTRTIVFFMAMIEILRAGVGNMVYGGKHGTQAAGAEDYGISYNVGCFLAWLYMCLFAMVWEPFFSWWVPTSTSDEESETMSKVISILDKLNGVLLPAVVGMSLLQHIYHVISTFIYVDARPVDSTTKTPRSASLNSKKNWAIRAILLLGVITSIVCGKAMFTVLEGYDLARVKPVEYLVLVLPIQVNFGLLMGSAVQFKAEQRAARKMAVRKVVDTEAAADEKERLLVEA